MITDGLTSFVTGAGTTRSAVYTGTYDTPLDGQDQLYINAYRSSKLARRIVEQPARDCFRKWREWQADADQISAIEKIEKRLNIRGKLEAAKINARLLGVCYVYISINGDDPVEPIDLNRIGADDLSDVLVLSKSDVIEGDTDIDALSPNYGKPKYYQVMSETSLVNIDPSRIVAFYGALRPLNFWRGCEGDSVLLSILPSVIRHEMMVGAVGDLTQEACVDVITIPGLGELVSNPEQESALLTRFALMKQMKSNNRITMLSGAKSPEENSEEWSQKQISFATLPDVIKTDQEELAAVAEMPRAYLFGTSAGGLGSTGELENTVYFDRIGSVQSNEIEPAINVLDECLIRSALGSRPTDVWYQWASLWQMSDVEKADIGAKTADKWSKLVGAGILPADAVTNAVINDLTELGLGGGIEQSYNDWVSSGGMDDLIEEVDEVNAG